MFEMSDLHTPASQLPETQLSMTMDRWPVPKTIEPILALTNWGYFVYVIFAPVMLSDGDVGTARLRTSIPRISARRNGC